MRRAKISIIGAGNVGATTAHWCAAAELGDIVLLDIPQTEDMPAGKALDLMQASPIVGFDSKIVGTTDYADTDRQRRGRDHGRHRPQAGHEPRRFAGDQRQDRRLGGDGGQKPAARNAIVIVVSNPLDAMVQRAWQVTGFPPQPRAGPGRRARYGPLSHVSGDGAGRQRRRYFGAADGRPRRHDGADAQLHVGGRHSGHAVASSAKRLEEIVERTRNGGAEIVGLLKTGSAYYAPAAATTQMVEAIVRDKKRLIPCAAYCDKEYGVGGYFVGVPVILGAGGVEKIIELKLTAQEQAAFPKERRCGQGTCESDGRADGLNAERR